MMQGIFRFLESGAHSVENGWLFNIPSNNDYPRAPWWTYNAEANEYEHTGVTAGIVCFILRFADGDSELYHRAIILADKLLLRFKDDDKIGDMGLTGYCALLDTIKQLGLSVRLDISHLSSVIKRRVDDAIVRDVSQWAHYNVRPSQFIHSPDSPFYEGNEDIIHRELDYLIETRQECGVWGITWHWHENHEKFAGEFAISKNWWMADLETGATGKLKLLRNFGRLE
jgi:hypothetical protein